MKIKNPKILYSHEGQLALMLHLKNLRYEYERIVTVRYYGKATYSGGAHSKENEEALEQIKSRMIEVEEALDFLKELLWNKSVSESKQPVGK